AVAVGVGIAVLLAVRSVAKEARLQQIPLDEADHSAEEHELLHDHIVAYRLDGPLFFAAAHRFLLELAEPSDVRVVILRMSHVTALDTTGALTVKDAIGKLEHRGITVLMSGLRADHRRRLAAIGALPGTGTGVLSGTGHLFEHTPDAIAVARQLVVSSAESDHR
ncbi:STAS domain-containing protein, partial [Nocardia sp. NPDC004722]